MPKEASLSIRHGRPEGDQAEVKLFDPGRLEIAFLVDAMLRARPVLFSFLLSCGCVRVIALDPVLRAAEALRWMVPLRDDALERVWPRPGQKNPAPAWPTVSTIRERSKKRFLASQLVSATKRQPWHAAPCSVRSSSAVVGSWSAHTGSPEQRRSRSKADLRILTNRVTVAWERRWGMDNIGILPE
jgi:hypothetical protein